MPEPVAARARLMAAVSSVVPSPVAPYWVLALRVVLLATVRIRTLALTEGVETEVAVILRIALADAAGQV